MAFAKARTALAQLEEKLRRNLQLAGEIGATFEPRLTPVIITADLREAGNASNQGRAFSWAFFGNTGVNGFFSLRTEADVYIDRLYFSNTAASTAEAWITVPGVAPAVAVVTLAGTWTDRKMITGDQVPLTQSTAFAALAGTNVSDQNRIVAAQIVAALPNVDFETNIMLPATSHLNFRILGTGSGAIGIRGRIWP